MKHHDDWSRKIAGSKRGCRKPQGHVGHSRPNKEAIKRPSCGLSPEKAEAYQKASERVWLLHASQVRYDRTRNQIGIEIPYIGEIVPIDINSHNWSNQDIESDFLVEMESDGTRKVTQLNTSALYYHQRFDEAYQEELATLLQKGQQEG